MKTIFVYEHWTSKTPNLVGRLYVDIVRGEEKYSFEYDDAWLASPSAIMLDPKLELYGGRQHAIGNSGFGIFSDSSPDRWGRVLMKRRERILADKEKRKPRTLTESE